MYLKNITAHVFFLLELILNSLNNCANTCCRVLWFEIKCLVLFKLSERRLYTIFSLMYFNNSNVRNVRVYNSNVLERKKYSRNVRKNSKK